MYGTRPAKKYRAATGRIVAIPPAPVFGRPRRKRRTPQAVAQLGVETKYVDQILASTAITTSWNGGEIDPVGGVNCLGACVQGTGESQRDGTKIVVKSIQIQGYVERAIAADQADSRRGNLISISLVMDRQTNLAQLNGEDVYTVADPECPPRRVVVNQARYKILKTWLLETHDVSAFNDASATGSLAGMVVPFSCYIKLNQVVNFVAGAGAGTIADFKDVSFHMIACGNVTVNGGDTVTYNSRVRFVG